MKRLALYISTALLLCTTAAMAQSKTSYFIESSTSRHQMNPAFSPAQGYVGIPVVSNVNISSFSNLGAGTFLFPKGGTTYNFLSSNVSANDFLSGIKSVNYIDGVGGFDIVDVGFRWKENFFWTVNVGVRSEIESSLPYEFFSFMKNGMVDRKSTVYNIEGMDIASNVYGQASIGFTADIPAVEGLSVGGKVKALFGLGGASMSLDKMNISLASDVYTVSSAATGYVVGKYIKLTENADGKIDEFDFDTKELGLSGYGFGVDLGIAYRISTGCALDGMKFSASVTDLGFVNYKADNVTGLKTNDGSATYSGAEITSLKSTDFTSTLDEIKDSFGDLLALRKAKGEDQKKKLTTRIYAGVEYPFLQDKMRVGLLYHCRIGEYRTGHELTASWNYSPVRQFNVALSYSFLNSRQSLGWQLSFTPKVGLNIFVGSDYTAFKYSSHGVPVNTAYLDFNFGLSVPIQGKLVK